MLCRNLIQTAIRYSKCVDPELRKTSETARAALLPNRLNGPSEEFCELSDKITFQCILSLRTNVKLVEDCSVYGKELLEILR